MELTEPTTIYECDHIGVALTTPVHVIERDGGYEARAGIAIMGGTNMTEEQMDAQGRNPFADDWRDNFARRTGPTEAAAVEALRRDAKALSESIWAI